MAQWQSGRVLDLQLIGRGFKSQAPAGQVVNTHVPLSPQYHMIPAIGR